MGMSGCATIDGICLFPPPLAPVARCGDVSSSATRPAWRRRTWPAWPRPPTPEPGPATVTLTGFVHVFSSGPDSAECRWRSSTRRRCSPADPAATPIAIAAATSRSTRPPSAPVTPTPRGCTLPLATGCALPVCNDGLGGRTDNHKYCRDNGAAGECNDRLRWEARYSIADIPTNKQLVIRVTGPGGRRDSDLGDAGGVEHLPVDDDRACAEQRVTRLPRHDAPAGSPKYQLNVNALSQRTT